MNVPIFFTLAFRHGLVSITAGTFDFLLFFIFFNILNLSLEFSYITSFILSASVALLGHIFITFKLGRIELRNLIFFFVQMTLGVLIGYFLILFFLKIGLDTNFSKLLQMAITFFFNLLFGKHISFKASG